MEIFFGKQNFLFTVFNTFHFSAPSTGQLNGSFNSLRYNIIAKILSPALGTLGGTPPTPANMQWLWPVAGQDENKIIVSGLETVDADTYMVVNSFG